KELYTINKDILILSVLFDFILVYHRASGLVLFL
ncbi:MAG: hypothetical protein ACJAX4_002282, partial [Clostridium sp.]